MHPSHPPSTNGHKAHPWLILLAVVLAALGQYALASGGPQGRTAGLLLSVAGAVVFVGRGARWSSLWGLRTQAALGGLATLVHQLWLALWRLPRSALGTGLAALCAVGAVALDGLGRQQQWTDYTVVWGLWLGTAAAYLWGLAWRPPSLARAFGALRAHGGELAMVGLLMAVAAGLRFYALGGLPRVIDGDEALIGQFALATVNANWASPFKLLENFGGVYLHALRWAMDAFGVNPFALRLLPAIGGTLAIPATYLLARTLFGPRVALIAASLLAASHTHLHFSRIASVAYIHGTWLAPLELYLFYSGLQRRSTLRLAVGGLVLGVHLHVYLTAQIVTAMLAVYCLLAFWVCRPLMRPVMRQVWAFWAGALLMALPWLSNSWRHPEDFFARLNTDGTFQSGWLAEQIATTGRSAVSILAERVAHAWLSLNHYPAMDFYGAGIPALTWMTSTLFVLGMSYALWRTAEARFLLINGYFWAVTVAVGVFALPPTADSYRMLAALPAAFIMAGLALDQVLETVWHQQPWMRGVVATSVVLGILVFNLRIYYSDFILNCRFDGAPSSRFASYVGNYLRDLPAGPVYLLSDGDFRQGQHGAMEFLSGGRVVENLDAPVAEREFASGTVLLAPPTRTAELRAWVTTRFGEAPLAIETDCARPLLAAFAVP